VIYLLYTVHVIVCVFLILVVLLQQGKGADLSVFGGGSTQTAFGARGATTLLHKLTVVSFVVFVLTTVGITILQAGPGTSSVMSQVAKTTVPAAPAPSPAPAAPARPANPPAQR
jgi:preprotein translocase subunit SecG